MEDCHNGQHDYDYSIRDGRPLEKNWGRKNGRDYQSEGKGHYSCNNDHSARNNNCHDHERDHSHFSRNYQNF